MSYTIFATAPFERARNSLTAPRITPSSPEPKNAATKVLSVTAAYAGIDVAVAKKKRLRSRCVRGKAIEWSALHAKALPKPPRGPGKRRLEDFASGRFGCER